LIAITQKTVINYDYPMSGCKLLGLGTPIENLVSFWKVLSKAVLPQQTPFCQATCFTVHTPVP